MKWVIALTIVIAAGIMGYFYVGLTNDTVNPPVAVTNATTTRTISIIHAYKDGEHRFSGEIKLPHSCYALDAEAVHDPKNPDIITIEVNAVDKILDQAICAKIPTSYPFQVLAEAPEDIEIHATFNGEDLAVKLTGAFISKLRRTVSAI